MSNRNDGLRTIDRQSLKVQLSDDFQKTPTPPDDFDTQRWENIYAPAHNCTLKTGDGYAVLDTTTDQPAAPGVVAYAGFASRHKHLTPNLRGVNGFEMTVADYSHDDDYLNKYMSLDGFARDTEDPYSGLYLQGFGMVIASFQGGVGSEPDWAKNEANMGSEPDRAEHRALQIHYDSYSKFGLPYTLNRSIIPGDKQKYKSFQDNKEEWMPFVRKYGYEAFAAWKAPFIMWPSVTLASHLHPLRITDPAGHRMGLWIFDNGKTAAWTLDGNLMDIVDITGFFDTPVFKDGAYLTIFGGGSYRHNTWKIADVKVYVSE